MASDDDWLKRIGRLLEADTGDLRALAIIAGKDPKTFYIGTNLDGVDIRGQDLRGMKLPGLNLDRVRRDEATRMDEPPSPPEAPPPTPHALVWVAASPDAAKRIKLPFDLAIYGPEDEDEFLHVAQTFGEGPIVLVGSTTEIGLVGRMAQRLAMLAVTFVTVMDERVPINLEMKARFRLSDNLPPPVVVIPRPAAAWSGPVAVSPEAMDAVWLLISEWSWRDELLIARTTYFLRARGNGFRRQLDAAAQISDRIEAERLFVDRSIIVRFGEAHGVHEEEAIHGLFSTATSLIPHYWGRRRNFDMALFLDPDEIGPDAGYLGRLARALTAGGWMVSYGPEDRSFGLMIANKLGEFRARFEPRRDEPVHRSSQVRSWPGVPFDEAEQLILTPKADLSRVARQLVQHRQFLVSGRDLLAVPSNSTSVWPFVAHQLGQMSRNMPSPGRDLYIRCVLASAFAQSNVEHPAAKLLRTISDDPGTYDIFRISLVNYKAGNGSATARLRVFRRTVPKMVTEADIFVDSRGVLVTDPAAQSGLKVSHDAKPTLVSRLFDFVGRLPA